MISAERAACKAARCSGRCRRCRGVAFIGDGNTMYAVHTSAGAILWSHQDIGSGSDFWGAPTISDGHLYVGNLYAFRP